MATPGVEQLHIWLWGTGRAQRTSQTHLFKAQIIGKSFSRKPSDYPEYEPVSDLYIRYFISGVEAWLPSESSGFAIIGDSITDGRGSTTNGNDR